jgi:hypothetical protein
MLWLRACVAWVTLAAVMVALGTVRERLLAPRLGELTAHQVTCFIGSLLILAVAYAALPWLAVLDAPTLQVEIGVFWLLLTLPFELLFGHWVAGQPWSRLLENYNLLRGRLLLVILVLVFLAPRLAGLLHSWRVAQQGS